MRPTVSSYPSTWGKVTIETRTPVDLSVKRLRREIASDVRSAIQWFREFGPREKDTYGFVTLNIAADRVVAQAARELERRLGRSPRNPELFRASMERADAAIAKVNAREKSVLSEKEANLAGRSGGRAGAEVFWAYTNETYDKGIHRRTGVDVRVRGFRTDRDYLRYNAGFLEEVGRTINLREVPRALHEVLKEARREVRNQLSWDGKEVSLFAVHRTPKDRTIIGYAVVGRAGTDDGDVESVSRVYDLTGRLVVTSAD